MVKSYEGSRRITAIFMGPILTITGGWMLGWMKLIPPTGARGVTMLLPWFFWGLAKIIIPLVLMALGIFMLIHAIKS